ncbi:MAG: putative sugar nucleotidyl transferase [Gimesia sp.]|nr:putative sugar nucleotidyl transferase [Gimesia sp.]
MRLAIFEDKSALQFAPISLMRPVFELLCGQYTCRERLLNSLSCEEWGVLIRPVLSEIYSEQFPDARINDAIWLNEGQTLLINGRWLPSNKAISQLAEVSSDTVGIIGNSVAYLLLEPEESTLLTTDAWDNAINKIAETRRAVDVEGVELQHPWDLVNQNRHQLLADFSLCQNSIESTSDAANLTIVGAPDLVQLSTSAEIDPFVVLDTRNGPIVIEDNAKIQAFTRIEGPAYIGRGTQLFRANIRSGTSVGPHCRLGGEIEESIVHGYVNKYHEGFLGHSYICPWVNLGAQTNNSDLKNDYSDVKVPLSGVPIETHLVKVGCYIGDHTKTGLNSLFNTGTSVGVMCMVLPTGELLPKHIPSFSRFWLGRIENQVDISELFQLAEVTMKRRGLKLTAAQRKLLIALADETAEEREQAICWWEQKCQARPAPHTTP